MLDPAAAPEGGGGSALARRGRGFARADGGGGGRPGPGLRLCRRGDGGIPAGRRRFLVSGDEHPVAGRTSGDRGGHGPRSGRLAVPGGPGRGAAAAAGGDRTQRPRHRSAALCRGPGERLPAADRGGAPLAAGGGAAGGSCAGGGAGGRRRFRSDAGQAHRPGRDTRGSAAGAGGGAGADRASGPAEQPVLPTRGRGPSGLCRGAGDHRLPDPGLHPGGKRAADPALLALAVLVAGRGPGEAVRFHHGAGPTAEPPV